MDGSPNSQSSGSRSRPSYVHPILNEDDRSHKSERASTSPSLLHLGTNPPDYDPEAPFPHTDSGYAYIHTPTGIVQDTTLPRFPSGPSSPSAPYSPHVQQQQQLPRPQSRSQVPSPAYTTPTTTSVITRISQPEYYHGTNIPFLGAPPIAQNIPLIQAPSGGFLCEQCSQTFTRAHDLRRHHISKHSEIKCQCICGRNFSRKDALLRHQRSDPASGYAGCEEAQQALLETAANSGSS